MLISLLNILQNSLYITTGKEYILLNLYLYPPPAPTPQSIKLTAGDGRLFGDTEVRSENCHKICLRVEYLKESEVTIVAKMAEQKRVQCLFLCMNGNFDMSILLGFF